MAEERRKGAPDRRRGRAKAEQAGEQSLTSPSGSPDDQAREETRARKPNESAALDAAEQLDESIRARQQEDRGEVF